MSEIVTRIERRDPDSHTKCVSFAIFDDALEYWLGDPEMCKEMWTKNSFEKRLFETKELAEAALNAIKEGRVRESHKIF